MRRTTLGALTNRTLDETIKGDKKQSAAGRYSVGRAQQHESGTRLSVGGNRSLLSRRSGSFYGKSSSARSDPRPVNQQKSIQKLINYLSVHGYDRVLSPNLLKSPTSKEFLSIVQFLFKKIEPTLQIGKMEEVIPDFFKRRGYPFAISKNSLCSIGSPLSWPAHLAALTWLVDILETEELEEMEKANALAGSVEEENFDLISQSYDYFMSGNDAAVREMDAQIGVDWDRVDDKLHGEVIAVEEEANKLNGVAESMERGPSAQESLAEVAEGYSVDIAKFNTLMFNLLKSKAETEEENKELLKRREIARGQFEALQQEIQQLEVRVRDQASYRDHVGKLLREIEVAKSMLQGIVAQKEQLQKTTWENEVKSSKQAEALEAAVREYHAIGTRLKLTPSTAKRAGGVVYQITVNLRAADPEDVLSVDLKGEIKPALMTLKKDLMDRHTLEQEQMDAMDTKLFDSREALIEAQKLLVSIEAQNKKLEARAKCTLDASEESAQEIEEKAERLSAGNAHVKAAARSIVSTAEDLLKETEKEYLVQEAQTKVAVESMRQKFLKANEMVISHKAYLSSKLKQVKTLTMQVQHNIETSIAPLTNQALCGVF